MTFIDKVLPKVIGKNLESTPKDVIIDQMNEPRPLPMGKKAFEEWSDRIIAGAMLPGGEEDPEAFLRSQKWTLANALLHLGPTESHKPDAYFIHNLRVCAVKQVAVAIGEEIREKSKRKLAEKAKNDANVSAGDSLSGDASGGLSNTQGVGETGAGDSSSSGANEAASA